MGLVLLVGAGHARRQLNLSARTRAVVDETKPRLQLVPKNYQLPRRLALRKQGHVDVNEAQEAVHSRRPGLL